VTDETRNRGRRRIDPDRRMLPVGVKLPESVYDRLWAAASREGVTISCLLRRMVITSLTEERIVPS